MRKLSLLLTTIACTICCATTPALRAARKRMHGCKWSAATKRDVCDHGWVLSAWGAYSACSQPCAGGIKLRTRAVIKEGDPMHGPFDSDASTCNEQPCSKLKKLPQGWHLPAPSSHGFAPRTYTPHGGFLSEKAEQGACILDKAVSLIDVLVSLKHCKAFHGKRGHPCYARAVSHLREHLEQCCEGREHYVMWKSNVQCMHNVGGMIRDWKYELETKVYLCQKGHKVMCDQLHRGKLISRVLLQGITAASRMYKEASDADITPKAKSDMHMCSSQKGCYAKITAYVQQYDPAGTINHSDN
jgi:hypothetical protein